VKNTTVIVFIAGLLSTTAVQAHTQGYGERYEPHYYSTRDRVDKRQQKQQRRIEQGIESGQLTPWELRKLDRQQDKIARLENRFKSDGRLSRKEKRILLNKLNAASQRIYHLKNNDSRYPVSYNGYVDNRHFD
jgi:hypothetical protein